MAYLFHIHSDQIDSIASLEEGKVYRVYTTPQCPVIIEGDIRSVE